LELKVEPPREIKQRIVSFIDNKEEYRISVPVDLNKKGNFTSGWMIITKNKLIIIYGNQEQPKKENVYKFKKLSNFKVKDDTGHSQLEAQLEGQVTVICHFTTSLRSTYKTVVNYLNQLFSKEIAVFPEIKQKKCPECGRVYPDDSETCPACIDKWNIGRRLWKIMRPYLKLILISLILLWLTTGASLIQPQLQRILVDDVLQAESGSFRMLILILTGMLTLRIFRMGMTIIRKRVMTRLGGNLGKDLRQQVYSKFNNCPWNSSQKEKPVSLLIELTEIQVQ